MWISLTIMVIVEFILLVFVVFFVTQFFNILFRGFAPYVSTRTEVIEKITNEIQVADGATVYELGCGKAGFLKSLAERFPKAKYIGVEYSFWPYFVAKLQLGMSENTIKIIKKNIFKVDLSSANKIYCYLNNSTMAKLGEKFKKECQPGTEIISYQFPLPNRQSVKEIEVRKGHKVYFYTL